MELNPRHANTLASEPIAVINPLRVAVERKSMKESFENLVFAEDAAATANKVAEKK